jgi:hypothetical protein
MHGLWTIMGLFDLENSTNGLIQFHYLSSHMGKNIVKGTMVTKVGVLTKDYILHMSYMYWSIKYQNCILNVIFRIGY